MGLGICGTTSGILIALFGFIDALATVGDVVELLRRRSGEHPRGAKADPDGYRGRCCGSWSVEGHVHLIGTDCVAEDANSHRGLLLIRAFAGTYKETAHNADPNQNPIADTAVLPAMMEYR